MKKHTFKKFVSLAMAGVMTLALGSGAFASTEVTNGGPVDPLYDLEYINSLPETNYEATPLEGVSPHSMQTDEISAYASIPSYVKMLHGTYNVNKIVAEPEKGASYYAISYGTTKSQYAGAFANIQLPKVEEKGVRTGFVSLGINNNGAYNLAGSIKAVDLGLIYSDGLWKAAWHDTVFCLKQEDDVTNAFKDFSVPGSATNVIIEVNPVDDTHVQMYLQPCIGTTPCGEYFKQTIEISKGIVDGAKICYYRFASLVPKQNKDNNTNDGASMLGGAFLNCQLFTPSASYVCWGMKAGKVERAWSVEPKYIIVTSTQYNDVFGISYTPNFSS